MALVIMSFTMLFSTVLVFLIHEKIVQTIIENAEYALERQKAEIDHNHFLEIERQYEAQSILIHDIKKHLEIIRNLARDEKSEKIEKYISSIYKGHEIPTLKIFSKNRLVNVIISKYSAICLENDISFNADIRDVDMEFIQASDTTSLLTNMLENACEAAEKTDSKKIDLTIDDKNDFVKITLINSCDTNPTRKDDVYVSSKQDKFNHGYGTKIIRKISRRYHGKTTYEFDAVNKKFTTTVVLRTDGKR